MFFFLFFHQIFEQLSRFLTLVRSNSDWYGFYFVGQGSINNFPVCQSDLSRVNIDMTHGVFSPVFLQWNSFLTIRGSGVVELVDSVLEVFSGVGTSRFFPGFGADNGLPGANHNILEFQSFDQISVPDHASVESLQIMKSFVQCAQKI